MVKKNMNIQFTVEMPTATMGKNSIAFWDTNNTVNEGGKIEVGVYRKATHASKYLDLRSHWPAESKSTVAAQRQNKKRVINDLRANGCPESFIKSVGESSRTNTQPRFQENPKAFAPIPCVIRVSGTCSTHFEPRKH